jgi:hypothetical protein
MRKRGVNIRQSGDIGAIAPEGFPFCEQWFVETKHVKKLGLESFFIKDTGELKRFWDKALREAVHYKRDPMLIARQNGWPILVISKRNHIAHWTTPLLSNEYVDVTRFDRMVDKPYAPPTQPGMRRRTLD